jgi:hypothetical protein
VNDHERYYCVGIVRSPARTGTPEAIFYLDLFAPEGDRTRTCIEPIADEI